MARRSTVGVFPHRKSWKFQVKDPETGRWKQVVATPQRFAAVGLPVRPDGRITKTDALRLKQRYEERLGQAESFNVPSQEIGLTQAIEEYLRFQRNTPAYLADKRRVLEEFMATVGNMPIASVSKNHLKAFEDHLRSDERTGDPEQAGENAKSDDPPRVRRLHPTTVARYLRYVRTFFNYCVREGWVFRSPFANFRAPKDESTPIEVFSLDQLVEIVATVRESDDKTERDYAVWMIAGCVSLGLRAMELQGLDWEAFDSKKRFVFITDSKNAHSRRPQPVPVSVMPLFLERQGTGPMFSTLSGSRASRNQMSSLRNRIAKRVPGFSWQRLRRTYATLLQAAGIDALIIDRLLGHSSRSSSVRVSAQHYIGRDYTFYQELVDAALDPLGEVFCSPS